MHQHPLVKIHQLIAAEYWRRKPGTVIAIVILSIPARP
jgi:hypothetical protein